MEPKYKITDKILNNIVNIESARHFINHSCVSSDFDKFFKNKAIISAAYNSTDIGGNTLDFIDVQELFIRNKNDDLSDIVSHEENEVLNYFILLENLDMYLNNFKIYSIDLILSINKVLTKKSRVDDSKIKSVNHVSSLRDASYMFEDFIDWLNNTDLQLILKCGIAHYELIRIHPFSDGNGRTSRILANFILKAGGFDTKYFELDGYYNRNRQEYYNALRSVQQTGNLTRWLEYFTTGFLDSIIKVKNEMEMIQSPTLNLEIPTKEIEIIKYLGSNKYISNSQVQELLNISSKSAYKHLKKLTDKKLINKLGNGRNTYYELNK